MERFFTYLKRFLAVLLTTIIFIALTLIITIKLICSDISVEAKELFGTTILETGQLKFLASMFLSDEEIQRIISKNAVQAMSTEVDTSLIKTTNIEKEDLVGFDENGIKLEEVSGNTFFAKILIIKDPAQVKVGTTYPWTEYGLELDKLVKKANAVAGVNGGLYYSYGNKGGKPLGTVVSNGQIQYNNTEGLAGLHIIVSINFL